MTKALESVTVAFFGGPDDGALREMPEPLSTMIDIQGHSWPQGRKMYRYHLHLIRGRHTYSLNQEWIESLAGGDEDEHEEIRGGGDPPR